jgi:DNA-binding LacI/PurR family transcriptional regulator
MTPSSERRSATSSRRARPPGSTDVARLAGVSQKTVSRVFRDEPYVSESVRERVLAAAHELGYRPNGAARALNSGRTRRLGVISLGSALYGPASLLLGTELQARRLGYGVSVVNTAEGDAEGIAGAVGALLEQGVDGIILSEPIDEGPIELDIEVPVLTFGSFPGLRAPQIVVAGGDATAAGMMATQHLLDLGHSTVHHLAGPQRWYAARERHAGWLAALQAEGIDPPDYVEGDWSAASGYEAGRQLLADGSVTAVFAANDDMAVGAIRAFVEGGYDVPGMVSVVGFDDIPTAPYLNPPLTTVVAQNGNYASRGLESLIQAIEGRTSARQQIVTDVFQLVQRASTAPPRGLVHPIAT